MSRPTQALINKSALRSNYQLAQSLAPHSKSMPIVKANGYGHGAVEVAMALSDLAPAFGVASTEEALALRDAGLTQPILLLEGAFTRDEILVAAANNFWLLLNHQVQVEQLLSAKPGAPVRIWIDIDTGMHRLGFAPQDVENVYRQLTASNNVQSGIVLATHFASADELTNPFTDIQIDCFNKIAAGIACERSLANSPAILAWPQSLSDWNRPGFMLYGNSPFNTQQANADKLKPVMTFKSEVIALRDVAAGERVGYGGTWIARRQSRIATVTAGYGDGYPRHAPNGTPVLINNKRCPLAGRVSMDMIMVDVTDLERVSLGDEAILWGPQLSVNEVASCAGTIGYELLTRMPARVPRIYFNG